MPNIFKDPLGWTALAVATPQRFRWMILAVVCLHAVVVVQVVVGPPAGAVPGVLTLCAFQCLFVYALRRLYVVLRGGGAGRPAE